MRCFLYIVFVFIYASASAQLNADFSAIGTTQGCSPLTVQFQDKSTGSPTQWFWDFGNGTTSFSSAPSVTYTQGGMYSVRLIVRNATSESYKEKVNYITVFATPKVNFSIAKDSGCAALQTSFTDSSQLYGATVKSWLWNFGDGNTSPQQNPVHAFNAAGTYNVSVTVTTTQGCSSAITKNNAVKAGNKPVAGFSAMPLKGCASAIRNFKNTSSGNITESVWDFGDKGISYDKNPHYHYQDTGTFEVKLTVSDNGCKDSLHISNYIHVDGPVSKIKTSINCADRFTVKFSDKSIDETNRLWNFGDSQTSAFATPVHHYTSKGIYIVSLIVTGSACNDTSRDTIHIKATTPVIKISPSDSFYCKYTRLHFSVVDYDSAISKYFAWKFKDGIIAGYNKSASIIHAYKQSGTFKPVAFIKDNSNCIDTIPITEPVIIKGPRCKLLC